MNTFTTTTKTFTYEYQKHFIRSLITGMSDRKLQKVAMFHFSNSRTILADWTVEQLAGDDAKFNAFLRSFPLSWHDSLVVNNRMLRTSLVNGRIPRSEKNSYAVKHILKP